MMRTTNSRLGIRVIAVIAVAVVLSGCGASTSAVLDALPTSTTAKAATTTEAPTTTEKSTTTTEEPTTTEKSTTTTDGSTTTKPETGNGGSGSLPAAARQAFMESCQSGGQSSATCGCIWDAIEGDLDAETLMDAGSSGSLPADLQQKIIDATMGCVMGGNN